MQVVWRYITPWTVLSLFLFTYIFQDIGAGKGKYYAVNFPLRDGIDDESYEKIFKPVSQSQRNVGHGLEVNV